MNIALVHALKHSPPPIEAAFARLWPEPRLRNILDDGLAADLARDGRILPAMTRRFLDITSYAVRTGARAVLFTCSAFGPCIEACAAAHPALPVLKPNSAMIDEAVAAGGTVGLLATFAPTLESMPGEFPAGTVVRTRLAEGALAALDRGDGDEHDRLAAQEALALASAGCDVIALAQFSLARAAARIAAETSLPVLTTPDCAVRRLRAIMVSGPSPTTFRSGRAT